MADEPTTPGAPMNGPMNGPMNTDEPWLVLGKHRYRVVGAQLQFRSLGELTPAEADLLMDQLNKLGKDNPRPTLLFDVREGVSAPAETRRAFVLKSGSEAPTIPTAVIGAGVLVRTLFLLTIDAARILTKRNIPINFFATEEAAQTWLKNIARTHYSENS